MRLEQINDLFGNADIYLIDAILKGHIPEGKVLDIGFGQGRNLPYFLQTGFDVWGIESDEQSIHFLEYFSNTFQSRKLNLISGDILKMPFEENFFDVVLCSRVLHLLDSKESFIQGWNETLRVTKPNGVIYLTVSSTLNNSFYSEQPDGRMKFPDGSIQMALTENILTSMDIDSECELLENIRTITHRNYHSETVFLLRKKST